MAQQGENRDNNDPYTGTENQHDFGKHAGIKWEVLMNDKSQRYKNYVDSKVTYNINGVQNRGGALQTNGNIGINSNQYNMMSGRLNQPFPGPNQYSPFNQNNEPLWAYNDDGILMRTIGMSKEQLQNGEDFVPDTTDIPIGDQNVTRVNDWDKSTRLVTVQSFNARKRHAYKIIRVEQGNKTNIYKGRKLAEEALEIPNNSIVVVDTDQTIGSHLKQNQGGWAENGRKILNNPTNVQDGNFVLWWFINPITAADSARKATVGNKKLFNNFSGITVKALVSYSPVELRGDNNNMRMNFNVKTHSMSTNINQSRQIWSPIGGGWTGDDFDTADMIVDHCKINNNAPNCSKVAKGLVRTDRPTNTKYMREPPESPNELKKYNNQIWHLCRKRTGDLFQGEETRRLVDLFGTTPLREYCFKKNDAGELFYPNLDETNGTSQSFCRTWQINDADAPWSTSNSIGDGPNIIHSTGDYPHLSWCLEHGLNVLFKPPKTYNFFYFKRQ